MDHMVSPERLFAPFYTAEETMVSCVLRSEECFGTTQFFFSSPTIYGEYFSSEKKVMLVFMVGLMDSHLRGNDEITSVQLIHSI